MLKVSLFCLKLSFRYLCTEHGVEKSIMEMIRKKVEHVVSVAFFPLEGFAEMCEQKHIKEIRYGAKNT